jgi:DNA invertase Pin-like site-specific DNA recombinase
MGNLVGAVAYFRTSSAANVGTDKDSEPRQREAVERFAKTNGYQIADSFYDAAVSGADLIENRPGFGAMLDRIEGNGVRVVLVESIDRFAREMAAGVLGLALMKARGVTVIAVDSGSDLTEPADPMQKAMIQIALTFAELEKARLVGKLKAARQRKKAATGRCEGRKPVPAETVALARKLNRRRPKGGQRSLRQIATALADVGHVQPQSGQAYHAASVARMIS